MDSVHFSQFFLTQFEGIFLKEREKYPELIPVTTVPFSLVLNVSVIFFYNTEVLLLVLLEETTFCNQLYNLS